MYKVWENQLGQVRYQPQLEDGRCLYSSVFGEGWEFACVVKYPQKPVLYRSQKRAVKRTLRGVRDISSGEAWQARQDAKKFQPKGE